MGRRQGHGREERVGSWAGIAGADILGETCGSASRSFEGELRLGAVEEQVSRGGNRV